MKNGVNKFSDLSDTELKSEFATVKKLFYPAVALLVLTLVSSIYIATNGKPSLFLVFLYLFAGFQCLKYIEKYSLLKKQMKSRNFLK